MTHLDASGNLIETTKYEYYDNGNYRTIWYYDGEGTLLYRPELDEQGYQQDIFTE